MRSIVDSSQLVPLEASTDADQLKWSARLRHQDVVIKGRTITRNSVGDQQNNYGWYGICCLTCPITHLSGSSMRKWSIQINTLQRGMIIGICSARYAQQNQFEFSGC